MLEFGLKPGLVHSCLEKCNSMEMPVEVWRKNWLQTPWVPGIVIHTPRVGYDMSVHPKGMPSSRYAVEHQRNDIYRGMFDCSAVSHNP